VSTSSVAVRQRHRGGDGVPVITPPAAANSTVNRRSRARSSAPDTERLRAVLVMSMEHRPQAEIAARYGVTVRTVRNWLEKARRLRIATYKGKSPEALLAETDHLHAVLSGALLQRFNVARAAGDTKGMAALARELSRIQRDKFAIREMLGVFDDLRLNSPVAADPHAQRAQALLAAMHETFFGEAGSDVFARVEALQPTEPEDNDPLY